MKNGLHFLYHSTWSKYYKFRSRYDKNLRNGNFHELSFRKRHQIISKLKRLYNRLLQLKWQLKLGAAAGMISISLLTSKPLNAQQLGPFVQNDIKNPFRPSPSPADNHHPAFVDIDNDGDQDLFIGTTTNSIIFLRNEGTATSPFFVKQLNTNNPLNGIVVNTPTPTFVDLDKDGDFDLVSGQYSQYSYTPSPNLIYYENTGDAVNPVFTFPSGEHPVDNVFSDNYFGHPAFGDIDNDGDLDVFVGNDRNTNYEAFLPPLFRETIKFWRNDGSTPVAQFTAEENSSNPISIVNPQFGGTINRAAPVLVDIDGDGDNDLFVGDVNGTVRFFENTGTSSLPAFAGETVGINNPLDGFTFSNSASPEFVDIDNDGDFDAVIGGDYEHLRFFRNTGSASSPTFNEITGLANPFDGFSKLGNLAPTTADINKDGFEDVVVGEVGINDLHYVKNNGDGSFIELTATDNPFDNLFGDTENNAVPAFADIDNDGDLDLFLSVEYTNGPSTAQVNFYRNNGSDVFLSETSLLSINQNYNLFSSTVNDFDGDGDFDVIIGAPYIDYSSASLKFIENIGDIANPSFKEDIDPSTAPINNFVFTGGSLKPVMVDLNHDGKIDLVTGIHGSLSSGQLLFFQSNGISLTNASGASNPFNGIDIGDNSHPAFIDFDNDGDLDALIGSSLGQLTLLENQNEAPVVSLASGPLNYTEGDGPVSIDVTLNVTDDATGEGDLIQEARIRIQNYVAGEDVLTFTPSSNTDANITGIFETSGLDAGTLILTGMDTLKNFIPVMQSIMYENTSIAPNTTARVIEFSVTDWDNTNPSPSQITINIISDNSIPVLAVSINPEVTYTENDPALIIDSSITLSDIDNSTFESATVRITTNFNQSEDALVFVTQNGISGTYDAVTGVLSLIGSASIIDYQTALQSVKYINNSEAPSELTRTIEYSVFDGTDNSIASSKDVNVTAVNDLPVLQSSNAGNNIAYIQNEPETIVDDLIDITDIDNTDLIGAIITINGFQTGDNLVYVDNNGISGSFSAGVLTLSGISSVSNYIAALQSIGFTSSNGAGTRSISFIVNDGTDLSALYTRNIDITAVITQPPVVNNIPATTQVGSVVTIDLCSIISDLDNTFNELTISIVSISSNASITITDCELKIDYSGLSFSGIDSIVLRATDPDGNSDENTLAIDVQGVNEGPLKIYNAISPNGDGSNDWWEIENLTTPNKIDLFNRWGDLVKTLNDYENIIDNTLLNDLPSGTYFYKIQSPQGEYTGYLVIKN